MTMSMFKSKEELYKTKLQQAEKELSNIYDVDFLASIIREVDGNNSLGAIALAEAIIDKLNTK